MSYINSVKNLIQRDPKYAVRGRVLQSQRYVERFQQQMHVLNFECMHGAQVDGGFGYFVSIENERNFNKSRLTVLLPVAQNVRSALTLAGGDGVDMSGTYYQIDVNVFRKLSNEETYTITHDGTKWVAVVSGVTQFHSLPTNADPWDAYWVVDGEVADQVISGTLSPDVAGDFYYVDDYLGRPRYSTTGFYDAAPTSDYAVVFWTGVSWDIAFGNSGSLTSYYRSTSDVARPDLASGWTNIGGSSGTPSFAYTDTADAFTVTEVPDQPSPAFRERVEHVTNYNEFICSANIKRQIVLPGTAPDSGTDIWESRVVPYDEWHEEKITVQVLLYNTLDGTVWDSELRQYVTSSRELVQTLGTSSTTIDTGVVTHIWYEEVRCGWWVKHTDVFNAAIGTYWNSENFYWPPVADNADSVTAGQSAFFEPVEHVDGYFIKYLVSMKVKEAFNDVCDTKIEQVFVTSVTQSDLVNDFIIPEAISHDGLIQDFKLAPTLHSAFSVSESIGTHPVIDTPTARASTYNATNKTDWPASMRRTFVKPYRGGLIKTTKTYYNPESNNDIS